MTINQPCVSPGTGTLSPDLRVFYQYGMVLGLDDFLQEQTHTLYLDYHHERALHGYGTVYGLHVTTSTPSGAPDDVDGHRRAGHGRRPVGPRGHGRDRPVRPARRLAGRPGGGHARDGRRPSSGPRASWSSTWSPPTPSAPDDLVPVPGQPCSTSAQVQVPVAAARRLGHRAPLGPAGHARLGRDPAAGRRCSTRCRSCPGLNPALSSEEAIVEAVLALATPATPSGSPPTPPPVYQLPAATADAAFDRMLMAWVTEVRPQLAPDLTAPDPSWDPSVLLSTITCTPETPFSATTR